MTTIYLVRHAEAEGNLYRILQGQYDSTVTVKGYRQLAALKRRFLDIPLDAVYASDLHRTMVTASALSAPKGLTIRPMAGLREIHAGAWECRTWAELNRLYPEMNRNFNKAPDLWHAEGSETFAQVRDRMMTALGQIIRENPGRSVAVASHGGALRTLIGTLEGRTLREIGETGHADNTSVTKLEAEGDEIRVIYRDDASHLPRELSTFARQKWHQSDKATEPGLHYRAAEDETGLRADALLEGNDVGRLEAHLEPDCLWIDRYELAPSLRGRNYGIQPMGQAVCFARSRGRDFVRLAPTAETAGFFEKFGFVRREDGAYELDIRLIVREIL